MSYFDTVLLRSAAPSSTPRSTNERGGGPTQPAIQPEAGFVYFNRLPPEVRDQIWVESFTPRVLCLHIRLLGSPSKQTMKASFDCTVATPGKPPSAAFRSRAKAKKPEGSDLDANSRGKGMLANANYKEKPPQLDTCRKSRELALNRYGIAFGEVKVGGVCCDFCAGSPEGIEMVILGWAWQGRKVSKGGIWIDFERDIVSVEAVGGEYINALSLVAAFSATEAAKVRRLCIQGREAAINAGQLRWYQGNWIGIPECFRSGRQWFSGFDGVRELILDGTGKQEGSRVQRTAEQMKDTILDMIGRNEFPGLKLRDVKIFREREWEHIL